MAVIDVHWTADLDRVGYLGIMGTDVISHYVDGVRSIRMSFQWIDTDSVNRLIAMLEKDIDVPSL